MTILKYFRITAVLICISFITLPIQTINAQGVGKLRGVVTDTSNGEVLAFSNAFIEELSTGASTNTDGMFIINDIPADKVYKLTVSYVGYETKYIDIKVERDKVSNLSISLKPLSIELKAIEKIGEKTVEKNDTDLGLRKISVKQLETLPKGVETDVIRSLQYLPGVRSTGDVSAHYYVRGGSSDQNLVLLNGTTLYSPFHSLGLFSVIDPDMINALEFYKGGFSAEYAGRLSSILNVVSKDGNKNRFSGKSSISFLTAKGLIEGPIPNGSFMLSGRFSYSDKILKRFLNQKTVPVDFYDISGKLNFSSPDIFNNAKFSLFTFLTSDKINYNDPLREEYSWKNNLIDFEWLQIYDAPFYSRLGISLSSFEGKIIPNQSNLKPLTNELQDVTISFDVNAILSGKDEIDLGLMIKLLDSKLSLENKIGVGSAIDKFAGNISIYGKYKFLRFENLGIDFGSRLNVTGFNSNTAGTFEPRLNITYRPLEKIALKGSAGIYLQELTTLSDEDEIISIFDPWIIIPDYLEPSTGISYSGGIEYNITSGISFQAETYYRKSKNIPILNDEKYFASDPDLVSGEQESYGSEFVLNLNSTVFAITASYSLGWVYKEIDDFIYYPKYDARHSGNLILEYNPGDAWSFSGIWSIYSGLPFTELVSYYDKYQIQNPFEILPSGNMYFPYLIIGDKNLGRLPAYHRLDLGVSKKIQAGPTMLTISLNAINVYDRKNIFYYERDSGRRVNMLPFLFTATFMVEI